MPEDTDKYIRIPVTECDITATIDISEEEGIKALYCGKDKKIATYLFEKDKGWTMTKAKKWVKDHKKDSMEENMEVNIKQVAKEIYDLQQSRAQGETEKRSYEVEMRVEDGDEPKIRGHAAVFNKLSVPLTGFREKVSPGAFLESIENSDIRALWNHNPDYVLGRNKSGTLNLEEDKKGLAIEITPPDTQWARDLMETIKRGDVDQMSFAFQVKKDSWDETGKESVRTLEEVELFDVSPVTYPAYPQTDVKVRSVFEKAGLDAEKLMTIMETKKAETKEDITVVQETIDILNSYLPEKESDDQGASEEGHVERLNIERFNLEFGK